MEESLRPELQAAIDALENKWNEYFHINEKDGPDTLYHYTSPAGLHGILSHRNLWASNVLLMNDASEVMYGRQVVADLLAEIKDKIPIYNAFTDGRLLGLGEAWQVYISCFCERGDLLSQWRGYGLEGNGFSIGMRRKALMALAGEPRQYVLFPVIYDVARQKELVQNLIHEDAFGTIDRLGLKGWEWLRWWREIGIQLSTFILRFKNPVFQEEWEWRILSLQQVGAKEALPVKVRTRNGVDIPYIELPVDQEAISCIVEGPRSELGTKGVRMLLDQYGFESTKIETSAIPLRG